jgi:outer membrane protein assembly factor BamA
MKRNVAFTIFLLFADSVTRAGTAVIPSGAGTSNRGISQANRQACCTVADVRVEGATAFSTDQIIQLSKLKSRRVAGEQLIAEATERLRRAYANRGYIKARVNIEPDPKPLSEAKQGVVDIAIKIDEGAVFRLRRLEFVGNDTTRDWIVRRCVLQQEGEAYSQHLMERSVRRLNGLRRFKRITVASIESHVDEQEHIVDLLIHLEETRLSGTRR